MRTDLLASCFLSVTLIACNGDKDGTADTDDTDGADTDGADTDGADTDGADTDDTDGPAADVFSVSGTVTDVALQAPAADGLCVRLLDPTPVLTGSDPIELASGTLSGGGAYSFSGITAKPTVGLLVQVADCGTENTTVYTSSTGIPASAYLNLPDGGMLEGVRSFSISMDLLTGMDASAEATTFYSGDLAADGLLLGFVLDAQGNPVDGATVTCAGCGTVFYMDGDSTDGLFATVGSFNPGTVAAGGAAFMIPSAQITEYTATAVGFTFDSVLVGSNPGSATIAAFIAQ